MIAKSFLPLVCLISSFQVFGQESTEFVRILIEPDEMHINAAQLSVIPGHGIYLLTSNDLISIEGDEEITNVHIPNELHPESIVFTENDVLARNDTTIMSCKSQLSTLFAFDTNQFDMMPSTDNSVFVTTRNADSVSAIYYCDLSKKTVEPFIRLDEDIVLIAGDTTQSMIVTKYNIYSLIGRKALPMFQAFSPIVTATLTKQGLVFSTENGIMLLEGVNEISLIGDRGCEKLLSDSDTLYIYYNDGALISYKLCGS